MSFQVQKMQMPTYLFTETEINTCVFLLFIICLDQGLEFQSVKVFILILSTIKNFVVSHFILLLFL
uniref:Uncharacterized protein n=1 Tax=Anguilla anguilla TaxID=7936 RepID=A0A0E9XHT3_ANGAN